MIPYNCTLIDAIRYHRHLVTDDDLIVEIERLQAIVDVVNDKIDFDTVDDLAIALDQKDCDLRNFFEKVKGDYEYRHGGVYDIDCDLLAELVGKDIKSSPNDDALIINNVDLDLLEQQRLVLSVVLYRLNITPGVTPDEIEALDGILSMLDSWSDAEAQTMTRMEALLKCRNHWQWLAITGSSRKGEYEKARQWPYECVACKHAGTKGKLLHEDLSNRDCSKCILTGYAWELHGDGRSGISSCGRFTGAIFADWMGSRSRIGRIRCAELMVNACNKAIEDLIVFGNLKRNYF